LDSREVETNTKDATAVISLIFQQFLTGRDGTKEQSPDHPEIYTKLSKFSNEVFDRTEKSTFLRIPNAQVATNVLDLHLAKRRVTLASEDVRLRNASAHGTTTVNCD